MLKKILVPLDGSGLAERALTYATALATPSGAQLVLLRAALSHTLIGIDPRERQAGAIHEAEQYLGKIAARVRRADSSVRRSSRMATRRSASSIKPASPARISSS